MKNNPEMQEACLNGCGLEESLGAETWPLTHTELFPIWLRLAQEPPTSPAPAAVFLAQTSDCRLWTPGCRITHSLILPWHLPESRMRALCSFFLTGAKAGLLSHFLRGPGSGKNHLCI